MLNFDNKKGVSRPKTALKTTAMMLFIALLFIACIGAKFNVKANITVLTREDGSGTKSAFMEIIGLKGKPDPANVIIQTGTAGILAEVKSNPNAIAYESLGYVTSAVKKVKIDGVDATVENIKTGAYKISRPLSVVYKESVLKDDNLKAFHTFLLSSNAQKIINEDGYVSIVDNAVNYVMNNALSGSIDVSGSTSLQPLMIKLAIEFEKLQPNLKINVSGGGSGTGYKNANEGVSAFGMISEEFALSKAPDCVHSIVCKDGIAVIVNPVNTISNLTMTQLQTIYNAEAGAGAFKKWNEIK
jgi:phosphate transport system substrate-binding protein